MGLAITRFVRGNRVKTRAGRGGMVRSRCIMSRELTIGSRKFYIVSEPHERQGWSAKVLEVLDEHGGTKDMGIETTGETRGMADERAVGVLQHQLRGEGVEKDKAH